jgi:squalene cyclase
MNVPEGLGSSLEKAFRFMEVSRNHGGLWSDFFTLAGESTYWVSGYTGYALCQGCDGLRLGLLEVVALRILDHQGEDGGWGYGLGVPADADSTSWCILFLSKLGMGEGVERGVRFLLEHQNLDGGFRTYASPVSVGRYMGLDGSVSFEGWQTSQLCVTGVATRALIDSGISEGVADALKFIEESQMEEGYWNPYWWDDALYSTFSCMWALKAGDGDDEVLGKACDWIAETQLADGGWSHGTTGEAVAFSTALALKGLMLGSRSTDSDRVRRGVEWLLKHQLEDGSWPPHYLLRIPHPTMKEPWRYHAWVRDGKAIGAVIRDHNRLFTTATAYSALAEFDRYCRGETS